MLKRLLLLLTFAFLTGQVLIAQVTTSSMSGALKDSEGATLSGATIVALHTPSGTRYTTVTQAGGQFTINNMRVGGPYQVTASYVGFENQTFEDIYLQLGETFILNGTLTKTNQTLENVVVTAGRRNNIMNANRTGSITNIGSQQINRLPTITRSLNDFTRLTPQANGNAIGGGNSRQNFITVDGSAFNNTFGIGSNLPANGSPISLDAIEEISVNVTPYDIRQSGFIGSSINSVTRSGTNQYSGSVYTYFRNQYQQGNKAGKTEFPRQRFDFNQYGVRVGGPIIKNKLFFFLNYETEKTIEPGQNRFAATATSGPGSFGPNNPNIARPMASELDAIATYLRTTYGYDPGPYQGYDFESDRTKILGRIDWNINDKHRLNFRYNQVEGKSPFFVSTSTSSTGVSFSNGVGRRDLNALHFSNSNYFQENNFYSYQMELSSKFSNRLGNILRASYNIQDEPRSSNSAIFPFVDIMKDGQPFTSFGYEPFSLGNLREVKTVSVLDNVTLTLGKHNLLGGLEAEFSKTRNGFQPLGQSYYRYASWNDFVTGADPIDFAQTFSFEPGYEQAFPTFKFAQYSAYAQDEITLNPKFRLTLGLRAELTTYPDVDEVRTNPLVAAQTFENGVKVNTGELPDPKVMLSPRVGFNYDVYGNRSLQIRGGTGIFTGRIPFVWIVGQSSNSGMLQINQQYNGASANVDRDFSPNIGAHRPTVVPTPGTLIPSQVTTFAEDFTLPQQWKTSLALDSRLPGGIIGSLEMIYAKDINVLYSRNVNLNAPTPLNVAGYADNRLIYPSTNDKKYINNITASGNPQAGATGQYNVIVTGNENKGYYASVTARLEKQFARGFFASLAYTHTQAGNLYDGTGDQPFNTWSLINTVNGANVPTLDIANYTVPNRVIASVSYRKEYFKHLGTTISLFYEGAHQGRFSYIYNGDFNRDGINGNDLLYIPRNPSEITFVSGTFGSGTSARTLSAQEQSDLFFKYIEQDDYLRSRKGQYAERNGALLPWRNQFDVKILQDLFTNVGGKRNTIQLSLDVFNFANLLNSRWGLTQTTNNASLLQVTNANSLVPGGTVKPTFRLAADRGNPITETFRDNASLSSTYYMQFGIRYIFN